MRLPAPTALLLPLALAACADDPAAPEEIVPSLLVSEVNEAGTSPEVNAEYDDARIHLDVTTWRNGCREAAGEDVDFDVGARRVDVWVYDRALPVVCFLEPDPKGRHITILALTRGTWTLVVHGARLSTTPGLDNPYVPFTVELEVTVP